MTRGGRMTREEIQAGVDAVVEQARMAMAHVSAAAEEPNPAKADRLYAIAEERMLCATRLASKLRDAAKVTQ